MEVMTFDEDEGDLLDERLTSPLVTTTMTTTPDPVVMVDEESTYRLRNNRQDRSEREQRMQKARECLDRLRMCASPKTNDNFHTDTAIFDLYSEATFKPSYQHIVDNDYSLIKSGSLRAQSNKRWACDCDIPSMDELEKGQLPCGQDCINRALNIECGPKCPVHDICSNRGFQLRRYAPSQPFFAGPGKGWGLRATGLIKKGDFVTEYVGEVIDFMEFKRRVHKYERLGQVHHYFMSLASETYIDAGTKGNWARFVNHSCEPNCETQKWNVGGLICIGFFALKPIAHMEEITIDYQFMQYGLKEQQCYCNSATCSGIMGVTNRQLQEKVRVKDVRHIERRILKLIALEKLRDVDDMTLLLQVMVQECLTQYTRLLLLTLLAKTENESLLKLFRQYNGLELIYSYMMESCKQDWPLKRQILRCLDIIPIQERKQVESDSNLLSVVEQWTQDPACNKRRSSVDSTSGSSSSKSITPVVEDSPVVVDEIQQPVAEAQPEPPASAPPLSPEEQLVMVQEIKSLAERIHQKWSGLIYETYRIPRSERHQNELELHMRLVVSPVTSRLDSSTTASSWSPVDVMPSTRKRRSSPDSRQRKRKPLCEEEALAREQRRQQFEADVQLQEQQKKREHFLRNISRSLRDLTQDQTHYLHECISKMLLGHLTAWQQKVEECIGGVEEKSELERKSEAISVRLMPLLEKRDLVEMVGYQAELAPDDVDRLMKLVHAVIYAASIEQPKQRQQQQQQKQQKGQHDDEDPAKVHSWHLPRDWTTARCEDTQKTYYFNVKTGQSVWDPPSGAKPLTALEAEKLNQEKTQLTKDVHVVVARALKPYCLPNCLTGRITCEEDYMYLVKKISANFTSKEMPGLLDQLVSKGHLQHSRPHHPERHLQSLLSQNSKERLKRIINQYMTSRGAVYQRGYSAN